MRKAVGSFHPGTSNGNVATTRIGTWPSSPDTIAGAVLAVLLAGSAALAGEGDPRKFQGKGAAVPNRVTATHSDALKKEQTQDINIQCPTSAPD